MKLTITPQTIGEIIGIIILASAVLWIQYTENTKSLCSLYGKSNYTNADYYIKEVGERRFCCSDDYSGTRDNWLLGNINDYETNCGEIPQYEDRFFR